MNKILASIALIMMWMGWAAAFDGQTGVELQPGEAAAEMLFNYGIGEPWAGGDPTSGSYSQYSQYFSFSQDYSINKGSASKKHIGTPKKHSFVNDKPSTVYFTYQMEAVPYTQYETYSTYVGGNELWILGASSWTRYAQVPQGASLSLLATSSTGGNGYLFEITPSGMLSKNSFYYYPGGNEIGFFADSIGQHIILFVIDGQVSNAIVVDVVSYQLPAYQPPVYRQPVAYQPTDMPPIYYGEPYAEKIPIDRPRHHRENDSPVNWPHGDAIQYDWLS